MTTSDVKTNGKISLNTVYAIFLIAGALTGGGIVWGVTQSSISVLQSSLTQQQEKLDIIKETLSVHTGQIGVIINRLDRIEQDIRDIRIGMLPIGTPVAPALDRTQP